MRDVALLLHARLRMVLNTILKQSREKRSWALILILVAAGAEIFFFRVANAVFSVSIGGPSQAGDVITGALTIFGGFVLVTSITFALSSLYFARDLDLLLSAPIKPADVILSRMYTQLGLGAEPPRESWRLQQANWRSQWTEQTNQRQRDLVGRTRLS